MKFRVAAARIGAVATAALVMTPLMPGTAYAGATCYAAYHDATIYAASSTRSRPVDGLDAGAPVHATTINPSWYKVSRADNDAFMGYMPVGTLNCDGG